MTLTTRLIVVPLALDAEGRVLLGRRAFEPHLGRWDLPGGFLDEEEHPRDCVRRELREEAGVEIEPLELLGVLASQDVAITPSLRPTMDFTLPGHLSAAIARGLAGLGWGGMAALISALTGTVVGKVLDSSGLGALVRAMTSSQKEGGDTKLLHAGPQVKKLLEMTKLDSVFEIHDDKERAVSSF